MTRIGTLDHEIYYARRTALLASIATAQAEYDRDSLAAELGGDLKFDPTVARANMGHLEDRLHSLDRAWVVAQEQAITDAAAKASTEQAGQIAGPNPKAAPQVTWPRTKKALRDTNRLLIGGGVPLKEGLGFLLPSFESDH